MANILDGKRVAETLRASLRGKIERLAARGHVPKLVVVSIGDDPASAVYIRHKEKACRELGMAFERAALAGDVTREEALARIGRCATDPAVSGIIVQLPIPAHLDPLEIGGAVPAAKDVDGLTTASMGALVHGARGFTPCTPAGVIDILDHYRIPISGARAVIVGRSNIVGKPLFHLLLSRHATVTVCHTRTADLAAVCREADILVAAVGKARMVTGAMVKPGATVIDVGINRADGKLVGDVAFDECGHAGHITPVPGGVGPMTVARLMANVVEACALAHPE